MLRELLELNYVYITNRLWDNYPGLRTKLKYLVFPNNVRSCLGILDNWKQDKVIDLFYNFTDELPDTTNADQITEVIAKKFIVIMSWDKLIDVLLGGQSFQPVILNFAPQKVKLHIAYLEDGCDGMVMLFSGITLQGNNPVRTYDKVRINFTLLHLPTDITTAWKDMRILVSAENLRVPINTFDDTTMGTFKISQLEQLMQSIYGFGF